MKKLLLLLLPLTLFGQNSWVNFKVQYDYKYNLKKSLGKANEINANFAIIIGENESNNNIYTVKNLTNGNQEIVNFEELIKVLKP